MTNTPIAPTTTTAAEIMSTMITAIDTIIPMTTTDTFSSLFPTLLPTATPLGCHSKGWTHVLSLNCMAYCSIVLSLVPDGAGLYLNGNQLTNYSIVNLEDIGEGECALICYTNSSDCCQSVWPRTGEWYFPNGSYVGIEGDMKDFYRNRIGMMVHLNRRNNARYPTGIYCCDVPGSNGNMCIGAYNKGDGKIYYEEFTVSS